MKTKQLDDLAVSAFCESMGMMTQSGIQTDEAVALLQEDERGDGALEQALARMREKTESGDSLASAMRETGVFPDYAVRMLEAAEGAGRVEDVLFQLSAYYRQQKTIRDKLRGAVTYPAVMLGLIIAVLIAMLALVLPTFSDVYRRLTGSLTESSYGYVRWAYGFCWAALIVMALLAAVLVIGLLLWRNGKRGLVEKALNKLPACRDILQTMGLFRFTSALKTFLASGEMQDEAVDKSVPMTDCEPVQAKLQACQKRMLEGHSIAQAAYDEKLFEPVYGRMLLAGERSGSLEDVLGRLTELLRENCGALTDRLVGVVDPLLSGVLMVTIGLSLLSVMLPLIGMMNAVG